MTRAEELAEKVREALPAKYVERFDVAHTALSGLVDMAECYEKLMNVQGKVLVGECERLNADAEALAEALQGAFNWIGVDEDEAKNDPNTPPVFLNALSVLARYRGEK